MLTKDKVTEIFFMADEFCKFFLCCVEGVRAYVLWRAPRLRVCKNQRIHMHKVFKGIAARDNCFMKSLFIHIF